MSWLSLLLTHLYLHFIPLFLGKFYRFFFRVQLIYIFHTAFSWFPWPKNKILWHAYSVLSPNITNVLIILWLYLTYISLPWLQLEGGKGFYLGKSFEFGVRGMSSVCGLGAKHFPLSTSLLPVWDNEWHLPHDTILWCVVNLMTLFIIVLKSPQDDGSAGPDLECTVYI